MSGRKRPCATCGRTTQAIGRVCRACADDIPLRDSDGAWRFDPFRRVQVWVPVEPAPPEPRDLSKLIACPTCHAKVNQTCRTKTGHRTTNHDNRLVPRMCPCGATLAPRKRYCEPCAAEATRLAKKEWRDRRQGVAA